MDMCARRAPQLAPERFVTLCRITSRQIHRSARKPIYMETNDTSVSDLQSSWKHAWYVKTFQNYKLHNTEGHAFPSVLPGLAIFSPKDHKNTQL